jgi:hypothetical protein
MHFEIFINYNCKHNSNWFHLCNRGKGFMKINIFNLCKCPSHQRVLCLATKPSTFYLILKIHLQLISLQLSVRGVNIQILLSCKEWSLQSMIFFFDVVNLNHSKLPQKNGLININRKNIWKIHVFLTIVGFSYTYWRILSFSIFGFLFKRT